MLARNCILHAVRRLATASNEMRLTFASPHKERVVRQVNVSTSDGDMGILAGHIPSILQLRPGAVTIIHATEAASPATSAAAPEEVYFVSGGFLTVNPDSTVQLAALEIAKLDELDRQAVQDGLKDAQQRVTETASLASSEPERAAALIHAEVYGAMQYALSKYGP